MKRPLERLSGARLLLTAAAFLALTQIATQTAQAQDAAKYEAQVRVQLDAVAEVAAENGYEQTHDYVIDRLDGDGEDSFTLTLEEGVTYTIASVCDEDCSDVDIRLYDENENLIDADESADDVPITEVTPAWTGEFTITVHMYECKREPCFYGIGVFGR